MSFNDLAKKEAADKKASLEKAQKLREETAERPAAQAKSTDPSPS